MKLLALDGNSIINRAFYGIRLLSTKEGVYTNAVVGFMNILLKLMEELSPDGVAAAFDLPAPTFRHKRYDAYKAGRKGMPDELASQLPVVKELLSAMGVKVLECEGYEADDILGTLARISKESGGECDIATGDRDALQLVGAGVRVLLAATKMGRPEVREYDGDAILSEYGVEPVRMIDVKALQGDASDNIPGIAGIGPKTALDLVKRFGSLDDIYQDLSQLDIRETLRQKLRDGKDSAYMSRELGTICQTVPISQDPEDYLLAPRDEKKLTALLSRLELFKLMERLGVHAMAETEQENPSTPEKAVEMSGEEAAALLERLGTGDVLFDFGDSIASSAVLDGHHIFVSTGGEKLFASAAAVRTHDAKALYHAMEKSGGALKVAFDSLLAAYLANPNGNDYSLRRLAAQYAGTEAGDLASQGEVFPKICAALEKSIRENGQEGLLHSIELPLARVLAEMETMGFLVDEKGIKEFGAALARRIDDLEQAIYKIIGYEFNLNSPKQLGDALFVKLGLPHGKKTKTGYSTSAEVLESLRYESEAVALLLEYRQLAKLKSTYCDGLLKVIGPDGRIHSTLNQTETRTGRISSAEPNLQNIPVRTELGRELRRFFIAPQDCVLVDADYSQIELRVLAHMSDDTTMIEAFQKGADIHTITASQVFGVPPENVTPLMRSRAKAVNFGIVYGISAFSLSKDIGVSRYEADQYIKGYLATYHGVAAYMDRVVEQAKRDGYVTTLYGRRRYLPELQSSNFNLRGFGERVARNMPVQGTAADIIKIAMIRVSARLKEEQLRSRLILQVHDELIVEAPEEETQTAARILREEMEGAAALQVPLNVDVKWGKSWYETK